MDYHLALTVMLATAHLVPTADRISADNITVTETKELSAVIGKETKVQEVKVSQEKGSWRLCYSGTKLAVIPFFAQGQTWTPHSLVECRTLEEVKKQISALGLELTESQQEALEELDEVPATQEEAEAIRDARRAKEELQTALELQAQEEAEAEEIQLAPEVTR